MYQIRKIKKSDYHHGFLELLGQLTEIGDISESEFQQIINHAQQLLPPNYVIEYSAVQPNIYVIEHTPTQQIVATGSLLIEQKFIHQCGQVAHIEDIVVDQAFRGQGLGQMIINHLIQVAQEIECYKVILNCSSNNVPFYEKCGFTQKEIGMVKYFD